MTLKVPDLEDPKVKSAIHELETMILEKFPGTVIEPEIGDDPLAVYVIGGSISTTLTKSWISWSIG